MKCLNAKSSAVDGLIAAISSLEDNGLTNAGLGSNLNSNGFVECDASLMNGSDLLWGAVGALQGIKNPIKAAECVLRGQYKALPLGLIPPSILVGEGARLHALSNGCVAEDLITEKSKETFNKYKRRLDSVKEENNCDVKKSRLDTVGAICVDSKGNVASGVSSGGIVLKMSGRVGQVLNVRCFKSLIEVYLKAAMMGCGAWAQNNIAVTTTGIGEYLIKTVFAKECAKRLLNSNDGNSFEALRDAFKHDFIGKTFAYRSVFSDYLWIRLDSPFLQNIPIDERLGGVLALVYDKVSDETELLWGHSTPSMCLGYMSSNCSKPIALVSEMSGDSKPGKSFVIEGKLIK